MPFIPGIELSLRFWSEVVRPVVVERVPPAQLAAGLLGASSEVLGFDTAQSTDHSWGPRVAVFVPPGTDVAALDAELERRLPAEFRGYPVRYPRRDGHEPRHQVDVVHAGEWFAAILGFDPLLPIDTEAWLATPTQLFASVTAGAVFEDEPGDVTRAREALRWYPDDSWRYVLACQWRRLAQHEHLLGRAGQVGDDLGSPLIAARLARDVVRLCFLIERTWAPYDKWLGTAFQRLESAAEVGPLLRQALAARSPAQRERHLMATLSNVAGRFNALALVPPIDPAPRPFFKRPFNVLECDRFAEALMATTPLAPRGWQGAIDQWVDSVDVLSEPHIQRPRPTRSDAPPTYHWQQPRG